MAEILFDSKMLVDPDSGNYAVRKNDTIIATDPGAVHMALDKENVLVVSKDTVNTKVAKQGVKEGRVRGF